MKGSGCQAKESAFQTVYSFTLHPAHSEFRTPAWRIAPPRLRIPVQLNPFKPPPLFFVTPKCKQIRASVVNSIDCKVPALRMLIVTPWKGLSL